MSSWMREHCSSCWCNYSEKLKQGGDWGTHVPVVLGWTPLQHAGHASSCLNILKLRVLAFGGGPLSPPNPRVCVVSHYSRLKAVMASGGAKYQWGWESCPWRIKRECGESIWYNIFVWGTCSSKVDTEICRVQPLSPSPHFVFDINSFLSDSSPEMMCNLYYALTRLFMYLMPCSCWWG